MWSRAEALPSYLSDPIPSRRRSPIALPLPRRAAFEDTNPVPQVSQTDVVTMAISLFPIIYPTLRHFIGTHPILKSSQFRCDEPQRMVPSKAAGIYWPTLAV